MHWLELKVREQLIPKDNEFLLKAPLLPNKYLYEKRGYTLAVYEATDEEGTYYLQTDNDHFYDTYKKYYEERFDATEKDTAPQNLNKILGAASDGYQQEREDTSEEVTEEKKETKEEEA